MAIFHELLIWGLVVGLIGVAIHPSPWFGALGVVVAAGAGSCFLVGEGGILLGLLLFLIYVGGMMVVFVYATAMAGEPYPEFWTNMAKFFVVTLLPSVVAWSMLVHAVPVNYSTYGGKEGELCMLCEGMGGVGLMYAFGSMLGICACALLLCLLVVLGLTRGLSRGALRVV